jgi:hypothetical protein
METWPNSLPFWATAYNVAVSPAILRDNAQKGAVDQRRISHRNVEVLSASLQLFGIQLPIFEHFIRDLNNEGTAIFIGPYKKGDTFYDGKMKISRGRYMVKFISAGVYSISCSVEIL